MKIILFVITLTLISCSKNKDQALHKATEVQFNKIINQQSTPETVSTNQFLTLSNGEYRMEVVLFQDNKWYYDLEKLDDGTGFGTWEYKDGIIILKAERDLFNMYIDIYARDEEASTFALKFIDRFGMKILDMSIN